MLHGVFCLLDMLGSDLYAVDGACCAVVLITELLCCVALGICHAVQFCACEIGMLRS